MDDWIVPEWPAPDSVRAIITTRTGGCSQPPFNSLNLADHVDDNPAHVAENRAMLSRVLGLTTEPMWLEQVHGCDVVEADDGSCINIADASTSSEPGKVCVVMTADCLPLLLCNRAGTRVAAVHAGWRGLADGVIEAALERFPEDGKDILAWMGPAIGPDRFEVGDEVREKFLAQNPADGIAFTPIGAGKWLADIYTLARHRLRAANCGYVGGGDYCTVSDAKRFFSYRRDGVTGRMASLIWIE